MLLTEFLSSYITNHEYGVSQRTVECFYKPAISDLAKHLGRQPTIDDLNRETVNGWIIVRSVDPDRSPSTTKTRRNAILALWRAAFQDGLTNLKPERIRKLKPVRLVVEAWDPFEISKLIKTAKQSKVVLKNDLMYRDFFSSLIMAAWDTGLRLGDLLAMEYENIKREPDGHGVITIVQRKVNRIKACKFRPETMEAIYRLMSQDPHRKLIWPLWCNPDQFYRTFKALVTKTGIRPGTFRWIRRASITSVEALGRGNGTAHAGHSDQRVTVAHYLDQSQLMVHVHLPPKISVLD